MHEVACVCYATMHRHLSCVLKHCIVAQNSMQPCCICMLSQNSLSLFCLAMYSSRVCRGLHAPFRKIKGIVMLGVMVQLCVPPVLQFLDLYPWQNWHPWHQGSDLRSHKILTCSMPAAVSKIHNYRLQMYRFNNANCVPCTATMWQPQKKICSSTGSHKTEQSFEP